MFLAIILFGFPQYPIPSRIVNYEFYYGIQACYAFSTAACNAMIIAIWFRG